MLRFAYLCDQPHHIDQVTDWIYQEFIHNIKHDKDRTFIYNRYMKAKKTELPIVLVALHKERCVGTVSLVKNDLAGSKRTPWLSSLYVDQTCRGQGIGQKLVEEISCLAASFGYDTLYLRTEHAGAYYLRLGWTGLEQLIDEYGQQVQVFSRDLATSDG